MYGDVLKFEQLTVIHKKLDMNQRLQILSHCTNKQLDYDDVAFPVLVSDRKYDVRLQLSGSFTLLL